MSDLKYSQIGNAARNITQVGRDYSKTIQLNFQTGNFLAVVLLVAPVMFCTWLGVETIKWGVTSVTSAMVSYKASLSVDRASKLVDKWVAMRNTRLPSENALSASNYRKIIINELENSAQVDFYLGGGRAQQSASASDVKPYNDSARAYFTRYTDGTWKLVKIQLTGKGFGGNIMGAGIFDTDIDEN